MVEVQRDESGLAHIVAISGGKDSTAMALRLREVEPETPFMFVCTPTGDELPEMFEHWVKLGQILGSKIVPIMAGTLKSCIAENNALPNWRMRFCTRQLKIKPFQAFLLSAAPAISYVGLRYDELDREGADYNESDSGELTQRYPLRDWQWDVNKVWKYLEEKGVTIPQRTDCARCFFQRIGEWYNLWEKHPEAYRSAVEDEERYGATYRSPGRDSWPASLREMGELFAAGKKPERSLRMMEKRDRMCRVCSL